MSQSNAFVSDVAFTPAVKQVQERLSSRGGYEHMARSRDWSDTVTPDLAAFIAERDSFYLGTASADCQPYIQHRGGPPGFLKVVDERTLAFADFGGNRQYITTGNLGENERAFIFLMDYANRRRVKIWGRAEIVEDDPELLERVHDPAYGAKAERIIRFHVEAWDVNCPQHIPRKIDEREALKQLDPLHTRIRTLEAENAQLRATRKEAKAA